MQWSERDTGVKARLQTITSGLPALRDFAHVPNENHIIMICVGFCVIYVAKWKYIPTYLLLSYVMTQKSAEKVIKFSLSSCRIGAMSEGAWQARSCTKSRYDREILKWLIKVGPYLADLLAVGRNKPGSYSSTSRHNDLMPGKWVPVNLLICSDL